MDTFTGPLKYFLLRSDSKNQEWAIWGPATNFHATREVFQIIITEMRPALPRHVHKICVLLSEWCFLAPPFILVIDVVARAIGVESASGQIVAHPW